ncbi:hypothetical protein L195_g062071, partial [Trifolium pratense]
GAHTLGLEWHTIAGVLATLGTVIGAASAKLGVAHRYGLSNRHGARLLLLGARPGPVLEHF